MSPNSRRPSLRLQHTTTRLIRSTMRNIRRTSCILDTLATLLAPPPQQPQVKAEPVDGRFPMAAPYSLPSLPGPQLNGPPRPPSIPAGNAGYGMPAANGAPRVSYPPPQAPPGGAQGTARIPQVDGPSSASSDSETPPPSQSYAPRASHPSLPQPTEASGAARPADSEEINSDLDDSDTDEEEEEQEGALGETDIVFCTYDKVARVKNKWKCVLKDGMIHVNNKDYLFAKCTCEFEW